MSYQEVANEFREWLDTVCIEPSATLSQIRAKAIKEDRPWIKHEKQERYRQQWLEDQDWYQRSVEYAEQVMEEIEAQPTITVKEYGEDGFWEQFTA